jgi:hypothetical protein
VSFTGKLDRSETRTLHFGRWLLDIGLDWFQFLGFSKDLVADFGFWFLQ